MSTIGEWRADAVKRAIRAQVAEDMETANRLVEEDARRRLREIREPEFGRQYRRILALFRLTSYVQTEENLVEGRIGIPRGEKGGDYGWWIEVGSRTAAAQPWLRPALIHNLRTILQLLGGQ